MAWENLAILSSVCTFADPSTVALWLFLHLSSRCKSRYVFWWLLVSQRPQMCLLSASENGHTVNDTLYPVSKQFKRAYGPDILYGKIITTSFEEDYINTSTLYMPFSLSTLPFLKIPARFAPSLLFNLFILWVCPHSLSVLLAYGWSLLVAFHVHFF